MNTTTTTIPADKIFQLPYYGGFQTYYLAAYMLREHDWLTPDAPDTFTVHAADDGRCLGYGDTKKDAVSHAQMGLASVAEQKSFEAGLIDRPYGNRIRK